MKNYKIIVQPIAEKDMQNIDDYISLTLCNPTAADKLLDEFYEQFGIISKFPLSCKELTVDILVEFKYRYAVVENYLIFYILDEAKQTAYIMRVLYSASDYISTLINTTPKQLN